MCPNPHHVHHRRALVSQQCIKYTCSIIDVIHILVLFGYHLKPGIEYVKNIYTANPRIKYLLMEEVSSQAKTTK